MSAALNNVTTQATYKDATTLIAPGSVKVNLNISLAAIYWQRAAGNPGRGYDWELHDEEFLPPGFYSFDLDAAAVRVRSAVAGAPAQVSIATRTAAENG